MSKKVILVADDIEDVRQAIMRTLGEDNFTFLEASSGEAAIDIVSKEKVDLILSDIAMPKGNGIELLEKLRSIDNPPKIILVTGYGNGFRTDDTMGFACVSYGSSTLAAMPML